MKPFMVLVEFVIRYLELIRLSRAIIVRSATGFSPVAVLKKLIEIPLFGSTTTMFESRS